MRRELLLLALVPLLAGDAGASGDDAETLARAATLAAEALKIEAEACVAEGRREGGLALLLQARSLVEGAGRLPPGARLELFERGSARAIARLDEALQRGRSDEALEEARWAARLLRAWRDGLAEAAPRREHWSRRLSQLSQRARLLRQRLEALR